MFNDKTKIKILILSISILVLSGQNAEAFFKSKKVDQANSLYLEEDYSASIEKYREALKNSEESDIINFNLGTALYKNGDYMQATQHLQKALLTENTDLKQKAHYNFGNTLYQIGQERFSEDIDATIGFFENALKEYDKALEIDPDDEDSRFNHKFVTQKLEQAKQIKESAPQESQSGEDGEDSDENQQDSQQENSQDPNSDNQQSNEQEESDSNNTNQDNQSNNSQQDDQSDSQDTTDDQDSENQSNQSNSEDEENDQQDENEQSSSSDESNEDQERKHHRSQQDAENKMFKELTENEAKMLLENYQQTIEPKGLLNLNRQRKSSPVLKDW